MSLASAGLVGPQEAGDPERPTVDQRMYVDTDPDAGRRPEIAHPPIMSGVRQVVTSW
jgi:hypothetical protein